MASTPIPRNGSVPSQSTVNPTASQKNTTAEPILPQAKTASTRRILVPLRYVYFEPKPETFVDPDPVFDTRGAAEFLRVSKDWLKKKRQRDQGPNYMQYGDNGPIRYALSDLMAYRRTHTVRPATNRKK